MDENHLLHAPTSTSGCKEKTLPFSELHFGFLYTSKGNEKFSGPVRVAT